MPARRQRGTLAALAAAALLAACAAPFEYSKQRMEQLQVARKQARGGWIVLRFPAERPAREVSGELLAAGPDTVFVLTREGVAAVPSAQLPSAEIALYEGPNAAQGSPVLAAAAGRAVWEPLVAHARFPQGLPPGLDRSSRLAP